MSKEKIIFIVGPTATGKSKTAFYLAGKINGEIISCDSMQIYKGMPIISNQPPAALTKKIPHYLLSFIPPQKEYNVSQYRQDALKKIKLILGKNKIPVFTGGTGLYMSILVDGIFEVKAEDPAWREKLYQQARKYGSNFLHEKLIKVDPVAAAKIHPNDTKRIVRALEVFKLTGKPISILQQHRIGLADEYDIRIFCLNLARPKLYQRIGLRTEKMFKQGLLKEAAKLLKLKLSQTSAAAIGLKELQGYFDGLYDLAQAKARIIRNTCLYSKRQLTWFRKDKRIQWINIKENDTPQKIAEKLWKKLS